MVVQLRLEVGVVVEVEALMVSITSIFIPDVLFDVEKLILVENELEYLC